MVLMVQQCKPLASVVHIYPPLQSGWLHAPLRFSLTPVSQSTESSQHAHLCMQTRTVVETHPSRDWPTQRRKPQRQNRPHPRPSDTDRRRLGLQRLLLRRRHHHHLLLHHHHHRLHIVLLHSKGVAQRITLLLQVGLLALKEVHRGFG